MYSTRPIRAPAGTACSLLAGLTLLASLTSTAGCSESHVTREDAGPAPMDAGKDAGFDAGRDSGPPDILVMDEDGGVSSCREQIEDALDGIPDDLDCAGLYIDLANKVVSDQVRSFKPATELWSDGAGKQRWVYLPEGEQIDSSKPGLWVFPIGTKFFKEFRANGRRVETRLYQKVRSDRWVRATFAWNRLETHATRHFGGDLPDITLYERPYHIPTGTECDQCHDGNEDSVMGFTEISLGMPGARGVTLESLVNEDRLTDPPRLTKLSMGDDGTGLAEPALTWLHINCGQSCHNTNQNAEAYSSGLFFTLMPHELDGRPPHDFDTMRTALDVDAKSDRFGTDRKRIVAGSPETSLVYELLTSRKGPKDQMPPIATKVVDPDHARIVGEWIRKLAD
jgi:hypothetical protein